MEEEAVSLLPLAISFPLPGLVSFFRSPLLMAARAGLSRVVQQLIESKAVPRPIVELL